MPTLIIMVLMDLNKLEQVVDAWYSAGSCGVTILESSGARHLLGTGARDDLPMFPSLHSLLSHQEVHHRTLFTLVGDNVDVTALFDATEAVVGSMTEPNNGIIMALPVIDARGIRKPDIPC
jgi:hypothetical protein